MPDDALLSAARRVLAEVPPTCAIGDGPEITWSALDALRQALELAESRLETAPEKLECFIVVVVRRAACDIPTAEAVALSAEWEAHDVATMALRLGHRAFFINTSGDDGVPTIEEYHGDE